MMIHIPFNSLSAPTLPLPSLAIAVQLMKPLTAPVSPATSQPPSPLSPYPTPRPPKPTSQDPLFPRGETVEGELAALDGFDMVCDALDLADLKHVQAYINAYM